jgi:hypothetical protein
MKLRRPAVFALELELGKPFSEASVKVGFTSGSPNHNRLLRNEKIMARIEGWRTKTLGEMSDEDVLVRACGRNQLTDPAM